MDTSKIKSLKLLEDRLANIENQVYGPEKWITIDDPHPQNTVIENLLHVNTLISSAVTGREKVNAVIKRLPELSAYLNTNNEEEPDLSIDAKKQLLSTMESEILNNYELFKKVQELTSVLHASHLRSIPQLSNKLNELNLFYLNLNEDSEALNQTVIELISKYNAIITNISKSLISLDAAITAAEIEAMPKKQLD